MYAARHRLAGRLHGQPRRARPLARAGRRGGPRPV